MPVRHPVRLALLVLFAVLAVGGCRSGETVTAFPASPPPVPGAKHTFVYVLNGADPLHFAGADELAERIRACGFTNTRTARWYGVGECERDIRATRASDPHARFVLIGYSLGSYTARNAANRLVRDGVPVVMVAYIGGDYLSDTRRTQLAGVGRVVNITGVGHPATGGDLFFNGTEVTGARNVRLAGVGHFDLPAHPTTFAVLHEELAAATLGD